MQYYLIQCALQHHVRQAMQYVVLLTQVDMHQANQKMFIYGLYNNIFWLTIAAHFH